MGSGTLQLRVAQSQAERDAVLALRRAAFGVGEDRFDAGAIWVLVSGDAPLCCYRLTVFEDGLSASYSGQFYDLDHLRLTQPAVELGRFCMAPGAGADALRLAFAGMARVVDAHGAGLLFGCASFQGAAIAPHLPALNILRAHQAPIGMAPLKKSPQAIDYIGICSANVHQGLRDMPPLLRSYLALGGWVSDHAVQDFELDTLHVFTGVEVAKIPPARAAALRAL